MKKLLIFCLIFLSFRSYAQVEAGSACPDVKFKTILNAPVKDATLSELKGKVVLIEFWGTWCGSCIQAMPHLQALQKQYSDKLQIISISDETPKRIGQFLSSRPSNYWFAADTSRELDKLFPHRLVPHTVLISPQGILIANTSPELVTNLVMDSIIRGEQVHLSVKKDLQYTTPENLIKTIFPASDTTGQLFVLDGEVVGAPGMSTVYPTDSLWSGRRITAINCSIIALYRLAYGSIPYERTINKTGVDDKSKKYRLDIIVRRKADLLPTLQKELRKRFDVQAKPMKVLKDVYVLKIEDKVKFGKLTRNKSGKRTYFARHGEIDQQALNMTDFADYLEGYSNDNSLVVNETENNEKFDIKFSYQPENPQSLKKILSSMGLSLIKEKRKVEMLEFYKYSSSSL